MILVYIFLLIGIIFQSLGTLALHRFPDVYTRLHGSTKCTTFGSIFLYLGVILYGILLFVSGKTEFASLSIHTFFVMFLISITNPTAAHAISRAAHRIGVLPKKAIIDKLQEEKNDF